MSQGTFSISGKIGGKAEARNLVWHYTDMVGLIGIVQNKELWATHVGFLNDHKEGVLVRDKFREYLQKEKVGSSDSMLQKKIDEIYRDWESIFNYRSGASIGMEGLFVACGSKLNDELTLWRNYGRSSLPVAVAFDAHAPLGVLRGRPDRGATPRMEPWRRVEYYNSREPIPGDLGIEVERFLLRDLTESENPSMGSQ